MATDGAGGEQPSQIQTLTAAACESVEMKCDFNMDNLSKPELLTLLSIMEGELEARDLVIEALRAHSNDAFIQERYGRYSLADPFLALQRDSESGARDKSRRSVCASPLAVLEVVMAHCKNMQERLSAQLAAAESKQKKLEQEKVQLQGLQQEHRRLSAQLKDEREKGKHVVSVLVHECKQLSARAAEESQRARELSSRLEEEGRAAGQLEEELRAERQKGQQVEAELEKKVWELDTEREQLRARLGKEEARGAELREESDQLRRRIEELRTAREATPPVDVAPPHVAAAPPPLAEAPPPTSEAMPKTMVSVAVGTDRVICRVAFCQTDLPPSEIGLEGRKKIPPVSLPAKPSPAHYAGMSLPKSGARGVPQSENGPTPDSSQPSTLSSGISPRVQAARYKFQAPTEQDQNGMAAAATPPSQDSSPSNRDSLAAKQLARHTVTQVLSRFTSPPTGAALRPGLPHPTETVAVSARLGPQGGLKSSTAGRIDRGNPPPIPPKKPGLSQTPSPPHPPIKMAAGEGVRSLASGGAPPAQTGHAPATAQTHRRGPGGSGERLSSPSPDGDSGWCPPLAPSLTGGDPVPLADGSTGLLHTAAQGNDPLLPTLLDPGDGGTAALYSAAQNGHSDCVKLLLTTGIPPEFTDEKGFTPLHTAAAHGHYRCVELPLDVAKVVDSTVEGEPTVLFLASESGNSECVRALLDAGADRTLIKEDGWATLHAAASAGHVNSLELLLCHPPPGSDPAPPFAVSAVSRGRRPVLLGSYLNLPDRDGWTSAHVAASKGLKDCLEVLCSHGELDIDRRIKCNRTIYNVTTDDCKELLENLGSHRVLIQRERICTADELADGLVIDAVTVRRMTGWAELSQSLTQTLPAHFQLRSGGGASLGLSAKDSVSSVLAGDAVWHPGRPLPAPPWDLIRRRHSQHLTVRLKGASESSVEKLADDSQIPLHLVPNYIRLVEQYLNVIFHGTEGSRQDYIANQISQCVKLRLDAMGIRCDIIGGKVEGSLTRERQLEIFIGRGLPVPEQRRVTCSCVVVLLEGLERAGSLTELLGDLCEGLESRSSAKPLPSLQGPNLNGEAPGIGRPISSRRSATVRLNSESRAPRLEPHLPVPPGTLQNRSSSTVPSSRTRQTPPKNRREASVSCTRFP